MAVATTTKHRLEYDAQMENLLDRANLDITQLARKANISYSQAHDIMVNGITGGRRLKTLWKLEKVLGVDLNTLGKRK